MAKGSETAESDIDLLVISDKVRYPDVIGALEVAEVTLGRTINPTVLTPTKWRSRRSTPDSFTARIARGPRLFVVGSEDDIA